MKPARIDAIIERMKISGERPQVAVEVGSRPAGRLSRTRRPLITRIRGPRDQGPTENETTAEPKRTVEGVGAVGNQLPKHYMTMEMLRNLAVITVEEYAYLMRIARQTAYNKVASGQVEIQRAEGHGAKIRVLAQPLWRSLQGREAAEESL